MWREGAQGGYSDSRMSSKTGFPFCSPDLITSPQEVCCCSRHRPHTPRRRKGTQKGHYCPFLLPRDVAFSETSTCTQQTSTCISLASAPSLGCPPCQGSKKGGDSTIDSGKAGAARGEGVRSCKISQPAAFAKTA